MRPALAPGDLVLVARRGQASVGAIALLDSPRHGHVLHRVVAVRPDGWVRTRGDANAVDDLDALPPTAVVGPVVTVVPLGRALDRWRAIAACVTIAAQQNISKR
jgi:signal peptidase I